jgi:hypothetical protein
MEHISLEVQRNQRNDVKESSKTIWLVKRLTSKKNMMIYGMIIGLIYALSLFAMISDNLA